MTTALVFTIGSSSAFAGQIKKVCTASSTAGASVTIASYKSGPSTAVCYAVSYDKTGSDNAPDYSIYRRGTPFNLSANEVPSKYSYPSYDLLLACLKDCSTSFSGAATVSANRAAANAKKTAAVESTKASSNKSSSSSSKREVAVSGNSPDFVTPQSASEKQVTNQGTSNYETDLAAAKADARLRTGVTRTTLEGESVSFKSQDDGSLIGVYNSGSKAGQWFDPDTKSAVHSPVEYSYGGKTYHSLEEAKAAKLDRKSDPENVEIRKFDDSGKQVGKTATLASARANAENTSESSKSSKPEKYDDCQKAYEYAVAQKLANPEKYKCSATNTIAKAAQISNEVLTGAGRTVVTQMGAQAASNSLNGSFNGAQEAAAKMAKTSKNYETVLGVANIAAASMLGKKANQHKQNAAAINASGLNENGETVLDDESGGLGSSGSARDIARRKLAIEEQKNARNVASVGAMKSAIVAAQSMAGAIVAGKNQKAAETNIRLAKQAAAKESALTFGYDPTQLLPPGGTNGFNPNGLAGGQNGDSTGTGTNTDDGTNSTDPSGPMLGDGSGLGDGADGINAPVAGKFKAGAQAGGGGGAAGAGGGASGGGGGAPAAQEEQKAAYASEFTAKDRYESAGTAAGGRGGAKAKEDGGIDLNSLLAQFLPKDEEAAQKSILDSVSFGGGRNVANEEPASFLDKNADLFQRIHETMSEKNRRGQIGI